MKRASFIFRMILACLPALLQIPSLLAIRIVLDVSKNQAAAIVQNADGSYQMVADSLDTFTNFLSYFWIWGIVLLCLAAAVAIPIVSGLRRGAPCIPVAAMGAAVTAGQAVLAVIFAFVCPGIYDFTLCAFMIVRYFFIDLSIQLPLEFPPQFLLIALGALFGIAALCALVLSVTELALWIIDKNKAKYQATAS